MASRTDTLALALLGLSLFAGCGGGFTDENVPEKVVTADEMKEMQETQKRIAEMGVKGVNAPERRRPASAGGSNQPAGR